MPAASILIKPTSGTDGSGISGRGMWDEWKLGTVQDSFKELIVSDKVKEFLTASHAMHEKCKICPHFQLCRGGCRRWRETGNAGELDLNYLCPAYEIFFEHCGERIGELGKMILNRYGTYQG